MVKIKEGKHIFGMVKVGARGQIVIPKEAREMFDIEAGDSLLVVGDEEKGLAIVKADLMKNFALKILESVGYVTEKFGIKKKGKNR